MVESAASAPSAPSEARAKPAAERAQRPQARTLERREAVLKAAMKVFGAHGYHKGALVEVAEEAGMTHAGVLHHFGSKEGLLVAMLKYRDGEEAAGVPARAQTEGPAFLKHLVDTVEENTGRRGVVQAYTVLSGESVADGHPAHDYFLGRTEGLRAKIAGVFGEVTGSTDEQALLDAASTLIAVMDGLQFQWLLDPDTVEMPRLVSTVIDELVARLTPEG
ncbi:TetR/AcrR family transcriptional regulator [Agromyces protaetiae]|uniref:TetR/AcrR family transcriptional regulator n=1 Tax=Agromyces protaetiae TaxID=2509455 RepID=A0A4P6FFY4_9MICO|nr:TetR/AcrR family transcriptional regulator [Agromyces protaetiae]QAY72707.1 TetR/AcrR family transcriptional regulator [Agromyces protaetiae]